MIDGRLAIGLDRGALLGHALSAIPVPALFKIGQRGQVRQYEQPPTVAAFAPRLQLIGQIDQQVRAFQRRERCVLPHKRGDIQLQRAHAVPLERVDEPAAAPPVAARPFPGDDLPVVLGIAKLLPHGIQHAGLLGVNLRHLFQQRVDLIEPTQPEQRLHRERQVLGHLSRGGLGRDEQRTPRIEGIFDIALIELLTSHCATLLRSRLRRGQQTGAHHKRTG